MEVPQDYNNFKRSLEFTLKWEGGYVNNPNDPGGETKWGISKRAYPDVDIKNLSAERAAEFYYRDYWQRAGCGGIAFPLCTCVFDTAVNCGVTRAVRWARDVHDAPTFLDRREDYYISIIKSNPKLQAFLKGWLNRLGDLKKFVQIAEQSDQGI
jgi:lysozyme family protein